MDVYRKEDTDALHMTGFTYTSPYAEERAKEEEEDADETRPPLTRREREIARCAAIDARNRQSIEKLCSIHESLMLRAYALHTGQPIEPLEPTADELLLHLQRKYSQGFDTGLFEYIKHKANTSKLHGMLRTPRNARGRVTSVTHVTDSDDHIQDLFISVWKQEKEGGFRGVDGNGQPVNILHWINKCFDNHFRKATTKQFDANKVKHEVYGNEARDDDKKPTYEEGLEQATKRSKGLVNNYNTDGWRFSPQDPNKARKLEEIIDRFTTAYPGAGHLLSQGLNYREVSERLGVKYSKLTQALKKLRDDATEAGITPREMGFVYRKPNKRATKPTVEAETAEVVALV